MKKRGLLLVLMTLLSVSLVSAQNTAGEQITKVIDNFVGAADPILRYIVGETPTGELLFVKFLFLLVLVAIIYYAVDKVPALSENKAVAWIITIAASIIAIRYLSTEAVVNFIWLPTGVLGITLAAFLPFIIFLFFIESFDSTVIRKVGWIAFAVIFFGLAIYRWDDFATEKFNLAWMYVIIAVLSILAIIFDKKIRAKIILTSLKLEGKKENIVHIQRLMEDLDKWTKAASNTRLTNRERVEAMKKIKSIEDKIANLRA